MKQKQTQKKVGDLMGGKVLDLDIIKAHDDGIREGISQGMEEGRDNTIISSIRSMMKNLKISAEEAMESLDIPKSERSKYMAKLYRDITKLISPVTNNNYYYLVAGLFSIWE